jgi:hypothetical protein
MVESNNLLFFSFKFEKFSFWSLYKVNKSEVRRKYGANTAMVPFEQLIFGRSREVEKLELQVANYRESLNRGIIHCALSIIH